MITTEEPRALAADLSRMTPEGIELERHRFEEPSGHAGRYVHALRERLAGG